jgi:hypothetical protein
MEILHINKSTGLIFRRIYIYIYIYEWVWVLYRFQQHLAVLYDTFTNNVSFLYLFLFQSIAKVFPSEPTCSSYDSEKRKKKVEKELKGPPKKVNKCQNWLNSIHVWDLIILVIVGVLCLLQNYWIHWILIFLNMQRHVLILRVCFVNIYKWKCR